jgi:hypothetical protein
VSDLDECFQAPQDRLTQLIDTAIKAVEAEENSGKSVVMALDYLRKIQIKYVASHCTTITQHESHMIDHSAPFNTDK